MGRPGWLAAGSCIFARSGLVTGAGAA